MSSTFFIGGSKGNDWHCGAANVFETPRVLMFPNQQELQVVLLLHCCIQGLRLYHLALSNWELPFQRL